MPDEADFLAAPLTVRPHRDPHKGWWLRFFDARNQVLVEGEVNEQRRFYEFVEHTGVIQRFDLLLDGVEVRSGPVAGQGDAPCDTVLIRLTSRSVVAGSNYIDLTFTAAFSSTEPVVSAQAALAGSDPTEKVNHPSHYGGDTTYEAIKVIDAWGLGFCLGNAVKYICRAGKKGHLVNEVEDLKKARWYLDHEIQRRDTKEPLHD